MSKWYRIESKAEKAEIWIYEQIGEDFWTGGGVTAKDFQKELSAVKASQIDLHINSPGGEVFDGITIYNLIKQHPANVTTYIDGIAASIASVIALAGNRVIMAENALYMMHNPSGMVIGTASDMRSMADVLDKVRGTMTTTYMGKTGKPEDEINSMLEAETWLTADEALEAGLIDEIGDKMDMAACAKFVPVMAKLKYKHIPAAIAENAQPLTKKIVERALRTVCTRKEAATILAKGFGEGLRDADPDTDPPQATPAPRDAEPQKPTGVDRMAARLAEWRRVAPSI